MGKFWKREKTTVNQLLDREDLAAVIGDLGEEMDAGHIEQLVVVYVGDKGITCSWATPAISEAIRMLQGALKELEGDQNRGDYAGS